MFRKNLYIIENALFNIGKNKGRNILLGVMIFAIITAAVIGMAIFNTTDALISDYKTRFGSEVYIIPERQMAGGNSDLESITAEQSLEFSKSEYLQSADMSSSLVCRSDTLIAVDQNENTSGNLSAGGGNYGGDTTHATMRLRGNAFQEFNDKLRKIEDGRTPESDRECIVSTEFAKLNNLSVGDNINLTAGLYDIDKQIRDIDIQLTVVGTYIDVTAEYQSAARIPYQNRRNEILTTFQTVANTQGDDLFGIAVNATYFLKSPDLLENFASEIRSKGLPNGYKIDTDKASYDKMIAPVEGLKSISVTFLLIVLALGAAIIILLSVIAIRERKYEIGVLRAMGMKKNKLALGLWTEIIALTCFCFIIGLVVGGFLSQPISDALLEGQSGVSETSSVINNSATDSLTSIDVSISSRTAFEIFGFAIVLASIAGGVSISRITKYEPIKILMERN